MKPCFKSCRRQFIASAHTRIQHILNKNSVSARGIVDKNVRYRPDELAILNDGRARHECDQEGTTLFNEKFTKNAESDQTVALGGNVIQVDF